jgi:hypothetical protein
MKGKLRFLHLKRFLDLFADEATKKAIPFQGTG